MRTLATISMALLSVFVLAIYLPMAAKTVFEEHAEKTHLFYSPVSHNFIYTEKIIGPVPPEALDKAEDHHSGTAYRDADGKYYTRVEFEKMLPFIYYKNMEIWGLLPLELNGMRFDRNTIKKHRRVLELKPGELPKNNPSPALYPLLESNPRQARLVFPEDRFRMTANAMEFVNADTNRVDKNLTRIFTTALKDKGFTFPARSVNGRFTVLKPFDDGTFLVDADYKVYHVRRKNNLPVVVRTPIAPELKTRFIKVAENRQRTTHGLLLAGNGTLHVLAWDNYATIPIPTQKYDPDVMDFKLIMNPLYRTAVYSDDNTVRAVVMDRSYTPLARHAHRMSRADITNTTFAKAFDAIFPFSILLDDNHKGFLGLQLHVGGTISLAGIGASLLLYLLLGLRHRSRFPHPAALGLVAITGIYGFATMLFLDVD